MAKAKKILLIEDDAEVADLTASLLKLNHYEVEVAYNGKEGLNKVEHRPDIVLLDITLPDMEGYEVCHYIREDERFKDMPIIMVSARDHTSDKVEGLYVGADDYVTKPFDSLELLARIESVLRRSQPFQNKDNPPKES